jgi:serine/threonine protein kinase
MHPSDHSTQATGLRRRGPTAPGELVGGYELLREIGRGGMAEVWVARRAGSNAGKFVAIKMILPHYCGDERYSRMFATEAQVASPLSHSNIVQVFDEGEDQGRSYLVMEWVDGTDLSRFEPLMLELQQRDPYLRLRVAAYVVGQVLHGLGYAHALSDHDGQQLGIVHRDISPHNVLVSVSGDVKVTDFGIAHRMIDETAGVDVKGKLRYMPPEQLAGRSHAPTVDLFSVGALLHELLDGRRFRHEADDHVALYHHVISGRVPQLSVADVPPELEALRLALLQPEPRDRPQTAEQALVMLKRWSGYAEMKTELAALCQQVTGVARPRTGPMLQAGASRATAPASVPSRAAVSATPPDAASRTSALGHESAEPDAPRAPWGVSSSRATGVGSGAAAEPGTALLDPAEHAFAQGRPRSEPTEALDLAAPAERGPTTSPDLASSTGVGAWPASQQAETTVSQIDLAREQPPRRRGWIVIAAAGLVAAIGLGAAAALLVPGDEPAAATASASPSKPAAAAVPQPEPVVAGPSLAPVHTKAAAPEGTTPPLDAKVTSPDDAKVPSPQDAKPTAPSEPLPGATTPVAPSEPAPKPAAPSKPASKSPASKPPASKPPASKPEPESPAGLPVLVHFRLESGLPGADVKIAGRVISVRPHYDTRIPSGRHAVKWRANAGDPWSSAGTIELGDSGEWKLFVGPGGAKLSRF